MARFKIFSKDGRKVRYEGKLKYNGSFGKPSYVEFGTIASPTPIDFQVGDYVDYSRTGFRYKLYNIPTLEKSARRGQAGDAFVYKNVQFHCATKDLEIALFRDVVMYDNGIHFSSIPNVDTYENVYGIADRIQANLDTFYGRGVWDINVLITGHSDIDALMATVKQFSVSDGTCLDALNQIYSLWKGISWVYGCVDGVHTITIGKPNVQTGDNTTDIFSYGKGKGLKVIARAQSTKNEMATRVYAYGSDKNLPTRYYNHQSIKDAESVHIPNLMLPFADWGKTDGKPDARLAYLEDANAVAKYGVIPKVLRFDGSGDLEDIYPSVKGMTIGDISGSVYPMSGYQPDERVDVIKYAYNPSDNGQYAVDSVKISHKDVTEFTHYDNSAIVVPAQTHCTIGLNEPIVKRSGFGASGKYTISAPGLEGAIFGASQYIKGSPKVILDVKIGGDTVFTKNLPSTADGADIKFKLPTVTFNNEDKTGDFEIYIRVEIDFVLQIVESFNVRLYIPDAAVTTSVEYHLEPTFGVSLKQIGFDISEMGSDLTDGLATLNMNTGMCAGRSFVIKKCTYDEEDNSWYLECQRQEDTSLSQFFPNSIYPIQSGDEFVLTDMQMPETYVTSAMERLHDAAYNALQRLKKPKMTYSPTVDSKAVYESEIALVEGLYMPVKDEDIIETEHSASANTTWVLIDSVTIAEDDEPIPVWSVTLKDEKTESLIQKLTGEITKGNRFIRNLQEENTRRPVVDDADESDGNVAPKVYIDAPAEFFVYSETGKLLSKDTISLTAVTEGINNPWFEWFYLSEEDWVSIGGEQTYEVEANSEEYYQNGELVEDFKVIVTDFNGSFTPGPEPKPMGDTYEVEIRIAKIKSGDGIMVALNNPSHIFPATDSHAIPSSDTVSVLAYRGMTPIEVEIGDITGNPEGMSVSVNKQDITIVVDENLVEQSGKLLIPVIVKQKEDKPTEGDEEPTEGEEERPKTITINLYYSWALALRGLPGPKGDDGEGEPGEDGEDGEDGYSTATLYLYMPSLSPSYPAEHMPGTLTYDFADGTLTPTSNLNGWSQMMPTRKAFEHIYAIMANVRSKDATVSVATSDWSDPTRFTGDNGEQGLMGKIMRGINEYSSYATYQGMNGDGMFYDVVYVESNDGSRTFYYLDDENFQGMPGTPSGSGWVAATEFDFVATKVLLADNAFIDVLSGNAIYLKNGDLPFAGMQGGEYELVGGKYVEQVNFFAGTPDGDPRNSKYKVYSDGSVYAENAYIKGEIEATSGSFGAYTIGGDTQGRTWLRAGNDNRNVNLFDDSFYIEDYGSHIGLGTASVWDGALLNIYADGDTGMHVGSSGNGDIAVFEGNAASHADFKLINVDLYGGDANFSGNVEVDSISIGGEEFDPSDCVKSSDVKYIVAITQAQYDRISPDDDVMYCIID